MKNGPRIHWGALNFKRTNCINQNVITWERLAGNAESLNILDPKFTKSKGARRSKSKHFGSQVIGT